MSDSVLNIIASAIIATYIARMSGIKYTTGY